MSKTARIGNRSTAVADEKKKEDSAEEAKKKGMSPLVLIAVGAVLGGAGVVFGVPAKTVEVKVEEPPPAILDIKHPDLISKTFNPKTRAGNAVAKVAFRFRYECSEDVEDAAFAQLKENYDDAKHAIMLVLHRTSVHSLQSEAGLELLELDLVNALNEELFGATAGGGHGHGGHEPIARVTRILWADIQLQ